MQSGDKFMHFIEAQRGTFDRAIKEVESGRKTSHWMWFIFPQLIGLGNSEISRRYAIKNLNEARLYLDDEILGDRLIRISELLLKVENKTASEIFGSPDNMKLRSSMTLFSLVPGADPVFQNVLEKFYEGKADPRTLELLNQRL